MILKATAKIDEIGDSTANHVANKRLLSITLKMYIL